MKDFTFKIHFESTLEKEVHTKKIMTTQHVDLDWNNSYGFTELSCAHILQLTQWSLSLIQDKFVGADTIYGLAFNLSLP